MCEIWCRRPLNLYCLTLSNYIIYTLTLNWTGVNAFRKYWHMSTDFFDDWNEFCRIKCETLNWSCPYCCSKQSKQWLQIIIIQHFFCCFSSLPTGETYISKATLKWSDLTADRKKAANHTGTHYPNLRRPSGAQNRISAPLKRCIKEAVNRSYRRPDAFITTAHTDGCGGNTIRWVCTDKVYSPNIDGVIYISPPPPPLFF